MVTIHAADFCTVGCQENYPDEYCSQYPPEGIPARPRTVDDWGTKFNITADMMKRGQIIYLHIIFFPREQKEMISILCYKLLLFIQELTKFIRGVER